MLDDLIVEIVGNKFADDIIAHAGAKDVDEFVTASPARISHIDDVGDYVGAILAGMELNLVMSFNKYPPKDIERLFFESGERFRGAHGLNSPEALDQGAKVFAIEYMGYDDLVSARLHVRHKLISALDMVDKVAVIDDKHNLLVHRYQPVGW